MIDNQFFGLSLLEFSFETIDITSDFDTLRITIVDLITEDDLPPTPTVKIHADQITVGDLQATRIDLSLESTGHIEINSITNAGRDIAILGDSITVTDKLNTSATNSAGHGGDISITSINGSIIIKTLTADGKSGWTQGGNGGDITITHQPLSNSVVLIDGDGLISADGGDATAYYATYADLNLAVGDSRSGVLITPENINNWISNGGLSGTITIEQSLAPLGEGTLTISSLPGSNSAGVFAGGVFDNINTTTSTPREIVEQYGGIIIDDFGVIKLPDRIYFNSVPQVLDNDGNGTLTLSGTNTVSGTISGTGSLIKSGSGTFSLDRYYNYAHNHDVVADAMLTDDGQLRFTFSPDELKGTSRTYQILSQPDEGTISLVDGRFVFYPTDPYNLPTQAINFKYRQIKSNGKTSNKGIVTVTLGDLSALSNYNSAAPFANPNLVNTDNQTAIDIDVLSNDFDIDHDQITLTNLDATSKFGISLSINADGTIAYDPTNLLSNLGAGEKVRDSFTYQIADPYGNLDRTMVFINITGIQEQAITLASTFAGPIQILSMNKAPVLAHNFASPTSTFNPLTTTSLQPIHQGISSSLERLLSLDDEENETRLELLLVNES